jgi:hypothetical protein
MARGIALSKVQEPLDAAVRDDLLILEERYGRRSTIITSQIPVDKWCDLIGDPAYADAIIELGRSTSARRELLSCVDKAPLLPDAGEYINILRAAVGA